MLVIPSYSNDDIALFRRLYNCPDYLLHFVYPNFLWNILKFLAANCPWNKNRYIQIRFAHLQNTPIYNKKDGFAIVKILRRFRSYVFLGKDVVFMLLLILKIIITFPNLNAYMHDITFHISKAIVDIIERV